MSLHIEEVLFESLENMDVITVELVPERKGLILKHCEYYVSSRRHGTTVTRRYNEFVQLYDVLSAKYPYRARFLQRRRAALQRWLTLVARHPVLAHDADTRSFLCESNVRLERPKHDEFTLAGAQPRSGELSTDEMQTIFASDQEQLRLVHLGLGRLFQIFEKVEGRCEAERGDMRELSAALASLAAPAAADGARWPPVRAALGAAATLAGELGAAADGEAPGAGAEAEARAALALEALAAHGDLCARLTRGLHAERAAAAHHAPHSPASQVLRDRHWYALRCALEEARVTRAYALGALEVAPEMFRAQAAAHARAAALWAGLHAARAHALGC